MENEEVLFNSNNVYVSTKTVEYDGQSYDPSTLIALIVEKDPGLMKGIIVSAIIAIIGIIFMANGGSGFGTVLLIGGLLGFVFYYFMRQDQRALTFVTVSFSGGRHTGKPDVFATSIHSYIKSNELKAALLKAKEKSNS